MIKISLHNGGNIIFLGIVGLPTKGPKYAPHLTN